MRRFNRNNVRCKACFLIFILSTHIIPLALSFLKFLQSWRIQVNRDITISNSKGMARHHKCQCQIMTTASSNNNNMEDILNNSSSMVHHMDHRGATPLPRMVHRKDNHKWECPAIRINQSTGSSLRVLNRLETSASNIVICKERERLC
jgi:hypothetical protein